MLLFVLVDELCVFFPKAIDTSGSVHKPMFTRKKGMTMGTDFNLNGFTCC
jgi:hypothetical protein